MSACERPAPLMLVVTLVVAMAYRVRGNPSLGGALENQVDRVSIRVSTETNRAITKQ